MTKQRFSDDRMNTIGADEQIALNGPMTIDPNPDDILRLLYIQNLCIQNNTIGVEGLNFLSQNSLLVCTVDSQVGEAIHRNR